MLSRTSQLLRLLARFWERTLLYLFDFLCFLCGVFVYILDFYRRFLDDKVATIG